MLAEYQGYYLEAAAKAEAALVDLAKARQKAEKALAQALKEGGMDEALGQGNIYGLVAFDKAIIQSAGAKGLVPVLEGAPERMALVGLSEGGDVEMIIRSRLGLPPVEKDRKLPRGLKDEPKNPDHADG